MRPTRSVSVALAVVVAAATACASPGTTNASVSAPRGDVASAGEAPRPDQSRLTSEEITKSDLPTAYDLVERLRRPWLRRQGPQGGEVVIYMDAQSLGGAEKLRDMPSVDVAEMQYLTNDEAIRRWGNQITGAVIVVVRRR